MRGRAASVAAVAIASLTLWPALAAASRVAGQRPVPPRVLRFLQAGPIAFRPAAARARPGVSAAVAARDAVRDAQWHPVKATGISLVRLTGGSGRMYAGVLTWLVAIEPRRPIRDGSARSPGRAANYVVAFIRARDGRFIGDAAGYSPQVAGRPGGSSWGMAELAGPPS